MKNLAICLLLLLGAVGCGDDYVVYETADTMVCIPKNDFQVLEYDAASMLADGIDSSYVLPLSVRADDQGKVRPEKNSVIIRVVMK